MISMDACVGSTSDAHVKVIVTLTKYSLKRT
jgi:hypothetical protein